MKTITLRSHSASSVERLYHTAKLRNTTKTGSGEQDAYAKGMAEVNQRADHYKDQSARNTMQTTKRLSIVSLLLLLSGVSSAPNCGADQYRSRLAGRAGKWIT